MAWITPSTQILVIGAGELGTAFLPHLSALPDIHITLGIRTISKYTKLASLNVSLLVLDISGPSDQLAKTFATYDIVISCTGFGQSPETVHKLANEILEAGKLREAEGRPPLWFFPWQWGADYDVIGDGEGLMPLFGAQKEVRDMLREKAANSNVIWTIVSTGIFMSFLFEQFWGVVDREGNNIIVRAFRDWNHQVTVTDVDDIGRILGRIVAGHVDSRNRILYVAGDTVSYSRLADVVERLSGKGVKREQWTIPYLKKEVDNDPDNIIKKYRLVFARDGVFWDKEQTVNYKLNVELVDVETYLKRRPGLI
ncbi:NAD(P)-binding protein [Lojkania enalia]|uniref:NAD(P)-binding protein n=1 Tax=Lojkania enalia TaxID=147567 RepID=A0A9P4MYY1_9PLEO|nr:NAD(P)-binding protein [Didymosphaeria enalia]